MNTRLCELCDRVLTDDMEEKEDGVCLSCYEDTHYSVEDYHRSLKKVN